VRIVYVRYVILIQCFVKFFIDTEETYRSEKLMQLARRIQRHLSMFPLDYQYLTLVRLAAKLEINSNTMTACERAIWPLRPTGI